MREVVEVTPTTRPLDQSAPPRASRELVQTLRQRRRRPQSNWTESWGLHTVNIGEASPGYDGATIYYDSGNDVTVILNPDGSVKTVYRGGG